MIRRFSGTLLYFFIFVTFSFATNPHDYEADARKMYKGEPDYEQKWAVEFHIHIFEGLLYDLKNTFAQMKTPFFDDSILKEKPLLLEAIKPASYTEGVQLKSPDNSKLSIAPDLFTDPAEIVWGQPGPTVDLPADIHEAVWKPDATGTTMSAAELRAHWAKYFGQFQFIDRYTTKIKFGSIPSPGTFEGKTSIEFAGRDIQGNWRRDYGKADISFVKTPDGWRIKKFAIAQLTSDWRKERVFNDVTSRWLSNLPEDIINQLRADSVSDDFYRRYETLHNFGAPAFAWFAEAHPRATVVDIDGDHWDDIYVWDILGRGILLHNIPGPNGTRTFEDATNRFGLNFRDVSSVVFADLNNDGIIDIVVGRWSSPSEIYFGMMAGPGKDKLEFVPADVNSSGILPAKVSSIAIADVNRDGYLDLYFATSDQYYRREKLIEDPSSDIANHDALTDRIGPPNVFLLNLGKGQFADRTKRFGLELERSTLAASFGDLNNDGYPDLVLANDFGPTSIYLNDGGYSYKDISVDAGADKIFFGMGTSIGDFNNDGHMDIYLTAMQSSAGARVTADDKAFAQEMDPKLKQDRVLGTRGNTLLAFDSSSGKFVDATSSSSYSAARGANWAYGAQFADFDNDGYLDIFSPNGHITLPRKRGENRLQRDF